MFPHPVRPADADIGWVDEQADRFESAWKGGPPPDIAEFLSGATGSRRLALLQEIVKIDLDYRRRRGLAASLGDYLRDFPELGGDERALRELEEYERRLKAPTTDDSTVPDSREQAERAVVPATVGKYVVIAELDRGGQACVYRGVHPMLGKEVVIKVGHDALPPELAETSRLRAEGRILAELDHPNLARVYDLDCDNGRPFLVVEYIRGRNLEQFAAQQRPTPRQAAGLVAKVARALVLAHRRGITHQDVKPKNILVDEAGQPRVIDFGLARLRHAWAEDGQRRGTVSGTVNYMAPEQARGETDRVNPRSDVFALGGVLYYLLVGHAPFTGATFEEALVRAASCDFDRDALRRCRAPRALARICLKAMAEDPDRRYATADRLAADLEAYGRRAAVWSGVTAGLLAFALLGLGVARGWFAPAPPAKAVLPGNHLSLRMNRPPGTKWTNDLSDIADRSPLTAKDHLKVRVEWGPAESGHLALFLVNGRAELKGPVAEAGPGAGETGLAFPKLGDPDKTLLEPPGTLLILACGKLSGPVDAAEVRRAWDPRTDWPELPQGLALHLTEARVKIVGSTRGFVDAPNVPDPLEQLQGRLDALRRRLVGVCDYIEGVAVAYTP